MPTEPGERERAKGVRKTANMRDQGAKAMTPSKRRVRDRLGRLMRKRGWHYRTPSNGLRARAHALVMEHHPWCDWGHRLMILVGDDFCGNWSEPQPPTWWYRLGPAKSMWRTGYPRHPLSTYQIVKSHTEFRQLTEGLNEDQMYEWQAIGTNQDGDLHLGHQYWGGAFYGLTHWDAALLRRYLRKAHRHNWYGLRGWLYTQGLNACVNLKKPFSCQVTPPKGSGGYSHWHCALKRRHAGPHRFGNYEWDPSQKRVEYAPTDR